MNERGIASLTALCIMLVLAIAIAAVKNIAARQADIVRYYRLENELQVVAESYFNETVANFSKDVELCKNLNNSSKLLISNNISINDLDVKRSAQVKVYSRKFDDGDKILILSIVELPNYNYGNYTVYGKVSGYMIRIIDDATEDEKYEFKGYFY